MVSLFRRWDCFPQGGSLRSLGPRKFTNWTMQDSPPVVLYRGFRPIAILEIPNCEIQSPSSIRLIKSYVCDLDHIIIDDETCSIMTVKAPFEYYFR